MIGTKVINFLLISAALMLTSPLKANELQVDRRVHDEVQTAGAMSLGLGHGGVAMVKDISAVRMNPGMLAATRQYSVTGAYHWPSFGRSYYQAGVVDSQTAGFAAGVSYTGFSNDLEYDPFDKKPDTFLKRRIAVGLGQVVGRVSIGINFQHVEGKDLDIFDTLEMKEVRGTTFGVGVAGLITNKLRFGLSGENLSNRNIEKLAPRTLRAGLVYFLLEDDLSIHLDYNNRQRVQGTEFEMPLPQFGLKSDSPEAMALVEQVRAEDEKYAKAEQLLISSFTVRVYDMLRLLGAYGHSLSDDRRTFAGGLAMVNGATTVAFTAAKPYADRPSTQQAFNISFGLSM